MTTGQVHGYFCTSKNSMGAMGIDPIVTPALALTTALIGSAVQVYNTVNNTEAEAARKKANQAAYASLLAQGQQLQQQSYQQAEKEQTVTTGLGIGAGVIVLGLGAFLLIRYLRK